MHTYINGDFGLKYSISNSSLIIHTFILHVTMNVTLKILSKTYYLLA